jgi:hypothetical protein
MDALSLFGLIAVTFMLIFYASEDRTRAADQGTGVYQ